MSNSIIDVLLVVDADLIRNNPSNTNAGPAVFLLAQRSQVGAEREGPQYQDGGNELWIKVKANDVIRWRATTLSRNANTSVVITNVYPGGESEGGTLKNIELMSPMQVQMPYLLKQTPLTYGHSTTTVSYWQATADHTGWLAYQINFHLLNSNGEPFSPDYEYSWDPYITIVE